MASEARIQANRRNSLKSTGPRTPEGKARSARNSYQHGLTAKHLVLSIEDRGEFEEFRARLFHEHQPVGTLETLLVSQIAAAFYRIQEAASLIVATYENDLTGRESATIDLTKAAILDAHAPRFALLRRYDAAAVSLYFRSIAQLTRLQAIRRRNAQPVEPPAVIQITDADGAPPPLGFVSQSASSRPQPAPTLPPPAVGALPAPPFPQSPPPSRASRHPVALKRTRKPNSSTAG